MPSQVYECPECKDRKLVDYSKSGGVPTIWCPCDGFVVMEKVDR